MVRYVTTTRDTLLHIYFFNEKWISFMCLENIRGFKSGFLRYKNVLSVIIRYTYEFVFLIFLRHE